MKILYLCLSLNIINDKNIYLIILLIWNNFLIILLLLIIRFKYILDKKIDFFIFIFKLIILNVD
jgi:hypothetical protein